MCDWNINPELKPIKHCPKESRWEIGFTVIVHNAHMYEGSGETDYKQKFCDEHFIGLCGCGNTTEFRLIGEKEWKDFLDHDNPFILEELVKKSYKNYISDKSKFNINGFL
ncbi:hypothetical protein LCGC14_1817020 [marine sediment metagenome]|uniref:Uncharacterized protein n=1 Tax=marine sediment metagenome TaxID=412755 RepID=A0A0F9IZU6_9ZZZZ